MTDKLPEEAAFSPQGVASGWADDKLKLCPQFCFSDWWNSLQDAERSAIIRDPQWSRERIFKAGYVEGIRATDTQVSKHSELADKSDGWAIGALSVDLELALHEVGIDIGEDNAAKLAEIAVVALRQAPDAQVSALVSVWSPMAVAVLNQMNDELAYPAANISADAQAETGIEITEKNALDIMRAFRTLGIADFGPLYDQDSERIMGRGYWLSSKGYHLRAALDGMGRQET